MSEKTEAIAQTAKEFALAAIGGAATIYLLTNIPESIIQYIPHIGISIVLAGMAYLMYSINLGRIRYRKHLNDLNNSLKNIKEKG
jgi:tellurite resistance protein TehA-like permease